MILRSVGVLSVGKMLGAMYGLIGLFFGSILSLISFAGGLTLGGDAGIVTFFIGAAAFIIWPIAYGSIGFIGGLIFGLIYNIVAKVGGGIQLNLE